MPGLHQGDHYIETVDQCYLNWGKISVKVSFWRVSIAKASLRKVSMSCKNCAIFLFYYMKCVLQHNVHTKSIKLWFLTLRADSRLAPSQWEMSSQSDAFSHWLVTNLEAALYTDILEQDYYVQCLSNRAGISLAMRPANDRCRYIVTTSFIDWPSSCRDATIYTIGIAIILFNTTAHIKLKSNPNQVTIQIWNRTNF